MATPATRAEPPTTAPTTLPDTAEIDDLDAELEAIIAELDPPPLEEIMKWFEPYPTIEEALAPLPDDPNLPLRRLLSEEDELRVKKLSVLTILALTHGDFDTAAECANETVAIRTSAQGADHWQTIDAQRWAAGIVYAAGLPAEARAKHQQIYDMNRRSGALYSQGQYEEALRQRLQILRTQLRHRGHLGGTLFGASYGAANCARNAGRPMAADALYRACLANLRQYHAEEHLCSAYALGYLARQMADYGDYTRAVQLCAKSLQIIRRSADDATPELATGLGNRRSTNLASVLTTSAGIVLESGDPGLARELAERSLDVSLKTGGNGNPQVLAAQISLSNCARASGDHATAEHVLHEVLLTLNIRHEIHPDIGECYVRLSAHRYEQGDLEGAAEYATKALEVFDGTSIERHQDRGYATAILAFVACENTDYARAEQICRESLRIDIERLGKNQIQIIDRMQDLAHVLQASGRLSEAEEVYRQTLSKARAQLKHDHLISLHMYRLGAVLACSEREAKREEARGLLQEALSIQRATGDRHLHLTAIACARLCSDPSEAEGLYREAIAQVENLRPLAAGDVLDRSRYFGSPVLGGAYSELTRMLLRPRGNGNADNAHRRVQACTCLERGRGRALLDLIQRGEGERHTPALDAVAECSQAAGVDLTATAQVTEAAREAPGSTGLDPMSAAEIAAALRDDEVLLTFDINDSPTGVVMAVLPPEPADAPHTPARNNDEPEQPAIRARLLDLSSWVNSETGQAREVSTAGIEPTPSALGSVLLPSEWRDRLLSSSRIFVVADGTLNRLPIEMLALESEGKKLWIDVGPPIVYGPSATVIMASRAAARRNSTQPTTHATCPQLVAIGDPVFCRTSSAGRARGTAGPGQVETAHAESTSVMSEPRHGVLVTVVLRESAAAEAGLAAGDVLLTYDGVGLRTKAELDLAIRAARRRSHGATGVKRSTEQTTNDKESPTPLPDTIPVTVWRNGITLPLSVAPGRMGVQVSPRTMPAALLTWRESQLDERTRFANRIVATSRSGFGDTLTPLPGTRVEVAALESLMRRAGVDDNAIAVLTGDEATLTRVTEVAHSPRFLHLATHGSVRGGHLVDQSALALTVPETPTPEDFGFLRLRDLLDNWGGKLEGTELVVLSGCDTATGRLERGDGFVGLTWGFLYAGAESVIASLWKVDDTATVLLMNRLYENLLGVYDDERMGFSPGTEMPKAEALHEAKRWLRHQSPEQNRQALNRLGFDTNQLVLKHRAERGRLPSADAQAIPDPFDYSAPRYWAAFVLIGSPD